MPARSPTTPKDHDAAIFLRDRAGRPNGAGAGTQLDYMCIQAVAIRTGHFSPTSSRMHRRLVPAALIPFLVLTVAPGACGGSNSDESGGEILSLELTEENGSGQAGTAVITPLNSERARIIMEIDHPPDVPQPAHVHPGPCGNLGDPVAALESLVDGRSETIVPMSLAELQRGGLVVHVHKSEADFEVSVACAALPADG